MLSGVPSLAISLYGLRRSLEGIRREAQSVAHAVTDGATADLNEAAVRSEEQQKAAEANAAAARRVNETLGSTIDIRV